MDEYLRARRLDPAWSVPAYNLGLLYKYRGDWARSVDHNLCATRLAPDDMASWWNLGIAATALARWDLARSAWRGAGIALPEGEGPIDYPCGQTPIRLDPDGHAEVVWSQRLDPARAKLESIPLPESGFRFADIVLNDGAATGFRRLNGREVPVLNCLQLLRPSRFSTWILEVELSSLESCKSSAIERLRELAEERELAVEDWISSIQMLCKACSEGEPRSDHDHPAADTGPLRRVAIAAPSATQAELLLEGWRALVEVVSILRFDFTLRQGSFWRGGSD